MGPVLSGEDIICLAHEPWHGPWKTYQQIMSLLARSNRVLYCGPPRPLRNAIGALRNGTHRAPTLERVAENLSVYHEPVFGSRAGGGRRWDGAFNWAAARLRLVHMRWLAASKLRMRAPILWVFNPMMVSAPRTFGEKILVYHVLDSYVELFPPKATALRAIMAEHEAKVLARADLVFAVSERLHQRCAAKNPHAFLVPNGVDYARFQAAIASGEIPSDMSRIRRPIIGYVGSLQPHIDVGLLERIADEHPEWSLALVGPDELGGDLRSLLRRPNVRYLGCKAVEEVPHYIDACDVCIMPYHATRSTVPDCDSIKLYEYLACGHPVVATNFPSIHRFASLVRIADSHEEFIAHVQEGLHEDQRLRDQRRAVAREHTWQQRVEFMSQAIQSRLPVAS